MYVYFYCRGACESCVSVCFYAVVHVTHACVCFTDYCVTGVAKTPSKPEPLFPHPFVLAVVTDPKDGIRAKMAGRP